MLVLINSPNSIYIQQAEQICIMYQEENLLVGTLHAHNNVCSFSLWMYVFL